MIQVIPRRLCSGVEADTDAFVRHEARLCMVREHLLPVGRQTYPPAYKQEQLVGQGTLGRQRTRPE